MIFTSIVINRSYRIMLLMGMYIFIILITIVSLRMILLNKIVVDDFTTYWSASRLNFLGKNPYDNDEMILQFREIKPDFMSDAPLIMMYPPWLLSITLPFAIMRYSLSRELWLILNTLILIICSDQLWLMYEGHQRRWMSWLLSITVLQAFYSLLIGNITILVLLGIVVFLINIQDEQKDLLSGAFIALCMIKPHVAYLFLLAVFIWVIKERRWRIFLGFAFSLLILTSISMVTNLGVLWQFWDATRHYSPIVYITPTFGTLLRYFLHNWDNFWLQYISPIMGGIWFLLYWRKRQHSWKWPEQIPLILLISSITAAYIWSHDQVILIPVILLVFIWLLHINDQYKGLILVILYMVIQIVYFYTYTRFIDDFWSIWIGPALLIWYYFGDRLKKSQSIISNQERLNLQNDD